MVSPVVFLGGKQLNSKQLQAEEDFRILEEMETGEFWMRFNMLKDHIREQYLQDEKDWLIGFSGGKDSSLLLRLVWEVLIDLKPHQHNKTIHVISSDTKVESHKMTSYLKRSLNAIAKNGSPLGIKAHLVQPTYKQSFFWNVIGRGVIAPYGGYPFQWCTKKMKIDPMNEKIHEIISAQPFTFNNTQHQATLLLGVREGESIKRAKSIKKFQTEGKFAQHSDFKELRVYHPIKEVIESDLWAYLQYESLLLPWGIPVMELVELYVDGSEECPLYTSKDQLKNSKSCGSKNSRSGCWTCLYAGRNDKMIEGLIKTGHKEMSYLAEWKAFLFDVTNDVRYREPLRRAAVKRKLETLRNPYNETSLLDFGLSKDDQYYRNYERAHRGNYEPGGFNINLRVQLLEKLLFAQQECGYQLIEEEEVEAILGSWKEEGYDISNSMIKPRNHQYDGAVVLREDWSVNVSKTTNLNPVFYIEVPFKYGDSKIVEYIKERQTKTRRSIFCYFDNKAYKDQNIVYNTATFIVCDPNIHNVKEANEYVVRWLFIDSPLSKEPYQMVGQSKQAAIDYLLVSVVDEIMEKNTEQIDYLPPYDVDLSLVSSGESIPLF